MFKETRRKINKSRIKIGIFFSIPFTIGLAIFIYFYFFSQAAGASWFDESWLYRAAIPISSHTNAENNVYTTVTIDTSTPIAASKMQSDCGDLRFTKENGELLPYFINASPGCNNAATTIQVNFDSFPAGAQTIYYYYGNPSVQNGFNNTAFATEASSYALGTVGAETVGPAPVLFWSFDDAQGTVAQDSSQNNLDGTLNNTPTWTTEDLCLAGKCLYFDGSNNENVSKSDDGKLDFAAADNFTLSAWVRKSGAASANTVILGKASANIGSTYQGYKLYMDPSGDFCFDTQDGTLAVDTACTSGVDFDDDKWHLVQGVKTGTASITLYVDGQQKAQDVSISSTGSLANSGTFYAGIDSDGLAIEWKGFIDEVKVYPYARSAAQVKTDYLAGKNNAETKQGTSAVLGGNSQQYLSNGLVGYWKMDEASWTSNCSTAEVTDSSGTGNNGISCPNGDANDPTAGKFGNAGSFDGTNDYVSVADNAALRLTTMTLSAWVNPTTITGDNRTVIHKGKSDINDDWNYSYAIGSDGIPFIQLGTGTGSGNQQTASATSTISTGAWTHITVTVDGSNIKFYKNGALDRIVAQTVTPRSADTSTLKIGIRELTSSFDDFFLGAIDEVRIYNRALSPKEVSDLYNWAPGPVGYWRMDDKVSGNSQTVVDSSGNGNNGTTNWGANASGMDCTKPGKYGAACQFDGIDDYVNSSAILNDYPDDFTASAWVKVNTAPGAGNYVATFGRFSGANPYSGFIVYAQDTGTTCPSKFLVQFYENSASATDSFCSVSTWTTGVWYHLAFAHKSSGTSQIYVNGVLENSEGSSTTWTKLGTNDHPFVAGARQVGGSLGLYLNGLVDDVRVYNYARTQKQIVSDMNAGHPAVGSPVGSAVGYWKFDEGADNTCSGGTNDVCNSGSAGSVLDGAQSGMAVPATSTSGWANSGKFGRALNFDGSNDYIDNVGSVSNFSFIQNTGVFTISSWVKIPSYATDAIQYSLISNTNTTADKGFFLIYDNRSGSTTKQFRMFLGKAIAGTPVIDSYSPTNSITDANWHHIVAVGNGSSVTFYIDAIAKAGTDSMGAFSTGDSSRVTNIGRCNGSTPACYFSGTIDEVKIYNYALTADEVKTEYNRGQSLVLGAAGTNSSYQPQAANQEYCVPGDTTSCAAPVGRWDFEEGSGTSAYDSSGNGNTGTLTGSTDLPAWTSGKVGKAVNFDGSDDHVKINTGNNLGFSSNITLEAWIKLNNVSGTKMVVARYYGTSSVAPYYMDIVNNQVRAYFAKDWNSNYIYKDTTAANLVANTWYHIVATYTLSATDINIYVNGGLQSGTVTQAGTVNSLQAGDIPTYIGAYESGGVTGFHKGVIDQVRIFNYARSAAQVAYDYNRGGPVGWWKLNECQGTVANDSSGSNTGTITIGASGTQTAVGTCTDGLSTSAWNNGKTGKINSSLNFDGTDDFVSNTSIISSISSNTSGSVSLWYKKPVGGTGALAYTGASGTNGNLFRLQFLSASPTTLQILLKGASDYYRGTVTATDDLNWHHIVFIVNASGNKLYLDGIAKTVTYSSGDATGSQWLSSLTGVNTLNIANDPIATSPSFFNGQIDDVKIWNYALTATQVKDVYNNGAVDFGPSTGSP